MNLYDEFGRECWYEPFTVDVYFEELDDSLPICGVEELHDALKTLTARQRFVVELRYGMRDGTEHTIQDIADLMRLSLKTVQEHLYYAEQRLHKTLTGEVRKNTP